DKDDLRVGTKLMNNYEGKNEQGKHCDELINSLPSQSMAFMDDTKMGTAGLANDTLPNCAPRAGKPAEQESEVPHTEKGEHDIHARFVYASDITTKCTYVILRKCTKHTNGVKNYFLTTLFCNHLHNGTKGEKKAKNYFDHEKDHKLLKRLKRNEMEDMLGNNDEGNALKIKKVLREQTCVIYHKYLKLLRLYHPDTYMKEKNEEKKKVKEEIFLLVYNKYKNFRKQYDNLYKSEIIDEAIYENEEEKSERLERYRRYSEGKRNDANHKHVEVYILAGILITFVTVFFICAYLPLNISTTREE
ncbi:conserved Plasmodium protein, unknown function, partial [Plasmodium ovale curtisi]